MLTPTFGSQPLDDMEFWRTPAPVRRYYLDLEFGQCHLRDNAARDQKALPVLCLHPKPLSGRSFTQLLKALSPLRFAVAPDLPGYGLSDDLSGRPSLAEHATMVLRLASATGLEKFAVVTVSSSAAIAIEMAHLAPDQIASLILIDPTNTSTRLPSDLRTDGQHLQHAWAALESVFGGSRPQSLKQRDLTEALQSYPHEDWVFEVLEGFDFRDALTAVTHPVHVIETARVVEGAGAVDLLPGNACDVHGRPDLVPGYLDLQAGPIADLINDILADEMAAPLPISHQPDRLPRQGAVRRGYAESPYGQLHYRKSEPLDPHHVPLTCFHASPQSGVIFEKLLALMGDDRIALAPDTPGFGESDGPVSPPEIEDYARAMASFLDALGIVQTDLLGFHTGSMTAVELARQRPDLVRRIVMVSAPIFSEEELAVFRAHYKPTDYTADGSHNVAAWQSFWQWRGPKQSIENYARNNALTLRGGPNKHWGHRAAFNYVLGDTLGGVDQPILVLNPGDDLRDQTLRAEPLMQNGSIRDIAPLSHGMFDDSTAEITALLREFLGRE